MGTPVGTAGASPGRVGAEVFYLYDPGDGGFGYAVNLTAPDCCEWGYAPFPDTA